MACTARFDPQIQRFRDPATGRFVSHPTMSCLHVTTLEPMGFFTEEGAQIVLTEHEYQDLRRQMMRALFTPIGVT